MAKEAREAVRESAAGSEAKQVPPAPLREINRAQVAMRLHCSVMQVRRFELEGRLHGRREEKNGILRVWFNPEEVQEVLRTWSPKRMSAKRKTDSKLVVSNIRGKIAARAFKLFREGSSLTEVVIATEADPVLVRQLYDEYVESLESGRDKKKREEEARKEIVRQKEFEREKARQAKHDHELRLEDMRLRAAERLALRSR